MENLPLRVLGVCTYHMSLYVKVFHGHGFTGINPPTDLRVWEGIAFRKYTPVCLSLARVWPTNTRKYGCKQGNVVVFYTLSMILIYTTPTHYHHVLLSVWFANAETYAPNRDSHNSKLQFSVHSLGVFARGVFTPLPSASR